MAVRPHQARSQPTEASEAELDIKRRTADLELRLALLEEEAADVAQRRAELEAREADLERSVEEVAEFASLSAHELRAPLHNLTGHADLLARLAEGQLDSEAQESLDAVRRGAERLKVLIEALLAYGRVGTGVRRRDDIDCQELVGECVASLAEPIAEAGATITYGQLPTVVADGEELGLVFRNLLANAVKFRRDSVAPEVTVSARRVGQDWRFTVADNGTGIEPNRRERVFHAFQRHPGRAGGSGLGLALSRRIVEGHGGRIWVGTGIDGGTAISFTIPAPVCWSPFG